MKLVDCDLGSNWYQPFFWMKDFIDSFPVGQVHYTLQNKKITLLEFVTQY
jgi:hypothetical protein